MARARDYYYYDPQDPTQVDLMAWLKTQPNKSATILQALGFYRQHQNGGGGGDTLGMDKGDFLAEVLPAIREVLRSELAGLVVSTTTQAPDQTEDQEITAKLDQLTNEWD